MWKRSVVMHTLMSAAVFPVFDAQAAATPVTSATSHLTGCIRINGQIPPDLRIEAVSLPDRVKVAPTTTQSGTCYRFALAKGTYLLYAKAAGWFGGDGPFRVDGEVQRNLALFPEKGTDPALAEQILEMTKVDQEVRFAKHANEQEFMKAMEAVDMKNLSAVRAILETRGWPGPEMIGKRAADAWWLLIQHSPPDLLKKCLPMMQAAADRGELPLSKLALSIDRDLMYDGKPQLYGSQFQSSASGKLEVYSIHDPAHLDERRARMDLGSFEEYKAQMMGNN